MKFGNKISAPLVAGDIGSPADGDIWYNNSTGKFRKRENGATSDMDTTGAGGGMTWTEVTGTSQAMAVDNGYIANNAALVTLTLPATAAVGKVVSVVGKGAGGWRIAQNTGQQIHFGDLSSVAGTGGYINSGHRRDCIEVICVVADTEWVVRHAIGNMVINT